jgi:DNA polymerase (family 10)
MKNQEIAKVLFEIAELLSLAEDSNHFRVVAYQRASQAVESLPESIEDLVREKRLTDIPGIGSSIAEKICEYLETGRISYLEELRSKFPAGLIEIMTITGMGPKKAKTIYDNLHVRNIDELMKAARERRIRDLPGFGVKSEENILKGIEFKEKSKGRILLLEALLLAQEIVDRLKGNHAVKQISTAGSLRRCKETIGDIDILVAVDKGKEAPVIRQFTRLPDVERVLAEGDTKVSVITSRNIQVDLRLIEPAVFGAALQYFTGSKDHNVSLRSYAKQRGLSISEYGVFRSGRKEKPLAAKTEEDVYAALKMDYIPPEMRENRGEIEAALKGRMPHLVTQKDIKGDIHIHSSYSDGSNSIEELGERARRMGYEWIISCDHSRSLKIAHGLSRDDLKRKIDDIRRFNEHSRDTKILCGTEMDILTDGELDYPDDILAGLDFVLASVHTGFKQSERQITQRIVKAIEHPLVNCIGHPSGRLLNKRDAYPVDIERILEAAAEHGKLLEINASPDRLDLYDFYCKRARELGIMLAIGTDAHALDHFEYMRLGIAVARRGWLEKRNVLNTLSYAEIKAYLARVRERTCPRNRCIR